MSPGLRKSLKTPDRATAIQKAEEELLNLRVFLKQGASVNPLSAENFVEKFFAPNIPAFGTLGRARKTQDARASRKRDMD